MICVYVVMVNGKQDYYTLQDSNDNRTELCRPLHSCTWAATLPVDSFLDSNRPQCCTPSMHTAHGTATAAYIPTSTHQRTLQFYNIIIWPQQQITRHSSGDEIANMNFFMTTSSTTFTQYAPEATEFGEITQIRAIMPFKVTDFGTNWKLIYDFLLVININLPYLAPFPRHSLQ